MSDGRQPPWCDLSSASNVNDADHFIMTPSSIRLSSSVVARSVRLASVEVCQIDRCEIRVCTAVQLEVVVLLVSHGDQTTSLCGRRTTRL